MGEREWPEILVMGYSEAGMFLRGGGAGRVGAVLSIHGGREFGVEWEEGPRLDLGFDDVEVPAAGDVVAVFQAKVRRRWEEEHGLVQRGPTVEDARAIVGFAREIRGMGGVLLCHCGGGVSRGPAAAILCLATWRGEGFEGACVEEVLRRRRGACPHGDLVRMGDEVLGRGGRLSAALRG
jgi:predicted protein tyrosine phosphatase